MAVAEFLKNVSVDTPIPISINNGTDFSVKFLFLWVPHLYGWDVRNAINDFVHCKNEEGNEFDTAIQKQPLEVFYKKKVFLKKFAKFTGKRLCQSLFLIKLQATLLKKRPWHRCFPVYFAKFLRTPFLWNTCR